MKFEGEPKPPFYIFSENEMNPFSSPTFLSAIVKGGWFPIAPGVISDVPGYGRGFTWRPPIHAGLDVIIVAGDVHGNATGGGMVMKVGPGTLFTNMTGDPSIGQCPLANGTEIIYPVIRDK